MDTSIKIKKNTNLNVIYQKQILKNSFVDVYQNDEHKDFIKFRPLGFDVSIRYLGGKRERFENVYTLAYDKNKLSLTNVIIDGNIHETRVIAKIKINGIMVYNHKWK